MAEGLAIYNIYNNSLKAMHVWLINYHQVKAAIVYKPLNTFKIQVPPTVSNLNQNCLMWKEDTKHFMASGTICWSSKVTN